MGLTIKDFFKEYPILTELVTSKRLETFLSEKEHIFKHNRELLATKRNKHSRGFWNTCLSGFVGFGAWIRCLG